MDVRPFAQFNVPRGGANSRSTDQAAIKQRLETVSGVDIQLKGDVAGFAIDRRISGACASDVLKSLCDNYRDKLVCRNEPGRTLIERKP
ncbi:hypothetical protein [Pseudomonas sp. BF-R-25]|uniref:hypothetical protein n=1 Tax=Pseudomonas sp. BF-R-25 TaxID=2832385 RepID=UPI001CC156A8|nr:hypothetical protein [Pseudomonas sp. BF-R-25]